MCPARVRLSREVATTDRGVLVQHRIDRTGKAHAVAHVFKMSGHPAGEDRVDARLALARHILRHERVDIAALHRRGAGFGVPRIIRERPGADRALVHVKAPIAAEAIMIKTIIAIGIAAPPSPKMSATVIAE